MSKAVVANDHGAVSLAAEVVKHLEKRGFEVTYLGIDHEESIDYPDKGEIWQAAGVQYLCYSTDVGIYYSICREIVCTSIQP